MHSINAIEEAYRRLVRGGRKITKLYSGNPVENGFVFPPEILTEAYAAALNNPVYDPDPKGAPEARDAIARLYARDGWNVSPENILISAGTSESFLRLFTLLCEPGDEILVPIPSYPLFDHIAAHARASLVSYRLDPRDRQAGLQDVAAKITGRTRAIVTVSPHNPTGAVADAAYLRGLSELANRYGLALICDEVFSAFYFGEGSYPRLAREAQPDLCFTLDGISKRCALPHLKLAWTVVTGRAALVAPWVARLEMAFDAYLSCHTPIQAALPAILEKGESFLRNYRAEVGRRRALMMETIRKCPHLSCIEPDGGFHALISVATDEDEEGFVTRVLEETGFFVHPSYYYDHFGPPSFTVSFLNDATEVALQSIQQMLEVKNK